MYILTPVAVSVKYAHYHKIYDGKRTRKSQMLPGTTRAYISHNIIQYYAYCI